MDKKYVGMRYIPVFAEPLDHNVHNRYEPFTIVREGGNYYISRAFVPMDIEVTNENYWLPYNVANDVTPLYNHLTFTDEIVFNIPKNIGSGTVQYSISKDKKAIHLSATCDLTTINQTVTIAPPGTMNLSKEQRMFNALVGNQKGCLIIVRKNGSIDIDFDKNNFVYDAFDYDYGLNG